VTFIVDSSFLVALYNTQDAFHRQASRFGDQNTELWVVPDVVLPETCYLFRRDFGYFGVQRFLEYFARLNFQLQSLVKDDLDRVRDIANTYADAEFEIVDCCIMAIAERLNVTRIATFDRRDFSIFQPGHCEYLELLP
jgi:hypothetical protein